MPRELPHSLNAR